MRIKLLVAAVLVALTGGPLVANTLPASWGKSAKPVAEVDLRHFAALDATKVRSEDQLLTAAGEPLRFAVAHAVKMNPANSGTLESSKDGTSIWRQRISASGALSLNLGFTRFQMAPGEALWIYTPDRRQVIGPLTEKDNDAHGEYWSPVLLGGELIIELASAAAQPKSRIELTRVNHGYRFFGTHQFGKSSTADSGSCASVPKPGTPLAKMLGESGYDKSGSCNMDVECLLPADPWRETAKAIGAYTRGGTQTCSGALINNTAQDRKMLFMTADHCGISAANASTVVVYWNHESPTCRTPGTAASGGTPAAYPADRANSGAFFRSDFAGSDFNILELDDAPPAAARLSWMGWDRSSADSQCSSSNLCAGIHHPSVDEKRITFVEQTMATTSYGNPASPGNGTHIWVHWDPTPVFPPTGQVINTPQVTEGGSSGSPLFNASRHFIGQLHGGPSACGSTGDDLSDFYGRLSASWEGGGTAATRARDWLDPLGTAPNTLGELGQAEGFANGFE